ncbi:MAG: YccF domain-containing protein [Marinifilaceae bacterium]
MRTLANIIWHFPFMGFMSAFFTFLLGLFLVVTIVAAPIGLGLIQLSKFLLTPFSSEMVDKEDLNQRSNLAWEAYSFIVRIIYFPFGLILAVVTLFQIVGLCISIVGIPLAIIMSKSLSTCFNPVNKVCVSRYEFR